MKRFLKWFFISVIALFIVLVALSYRAKPNAIEYGMTFSVPYARELGLDWKEVYREMFRDLQVTRVRIPVYWSQVEPRKNEYVWSDIDFQLREARAYDAEVILAIGRRVPRWPECHVPDWTQELSWEKEKEEARAYIRAAVTRYKDDPTVVMWQVENEPYLRYFADDHCGELDEGFLEEEIALVRSLEDRPILLTDSGNLGTWAGAYKRGDIFGTSVYLYFWNESVGAFRTILPPAYYRIKANVMRIFFGERPIILSELSLEPWLAAHIEDVPPEEQLSRMNITKFHEIIEYAKKTHLATQYLWGVEWWYYMKTKQRHPEFWEAGKALFRDE